MRVVLLVLLCSIFNVSAFAAGACHEQILNYNKDKFHKFLESKVNRNKLPTNQMDFYKTIGFKSIGSEDGVKLILNIKMSELESISSSAEVKQFKSLIKEYFEKNKRKGTSVSDNSFYPNEDNLPCIDETLFLTEYKHCLNGFDSLVNSEVSDLVGLVNKVFSAFNLSLVEKNASIYSPQKTVEVILPDQLNSLDGFSLNVTSNVEINTSTIGSTVENCSLDKSKKLISCNFEGVGRKEVELQNGTYSGFIVLEYKKDSSYRLNPIGNSQFNVLKVSEQNPEGIAVENFEITSDSKICFKTADLITCKPQDFESKLLVTIEGSSLSEKLRAANDFYFVGDTSKNPAFIFLRPVVLVNGEESEEALNSVGFSSIENCEEISKKRKILKCLKKDVIYNVKATRTIEESSVEIEYPVGLSNAIGKLDLKMSQYELSSTEQHHLVQVTSDGVALSIDSLESLGISINVEGESKFISNQSILISSREEDDYSFKVTIKKNEQVVTKSVTIPKYSSSKGYFFETIKENRYCRFNLLKINDVSDYSDVGSELFNSEYFSVEVESSKKVNCSSLMNNESSTQLICSIPRNHLSGSVSVKLLSNGEVVRTQSCGLFNEDYEKEDEDDEGEDDDGFDGDTYRKKSASSKVVESAADVFSGIFPEYLNSKFGSQQPQYYNPLMYSPYYMGGPMLPSTYGMPGAWDTRYIFDPATY